MTHGRSFVDEDEDPFGHGGQLDEPLVPFTGVGGHAAPRSGSLQLNAQGSEGTEPCISQHEATDGSVATLTAPEGELGEERLGAHESHVLTRSAHVVWCRLCGRHAAVRLGVGLQRRCVGVAVGAYFARIPSQPLAS